LRGRPTDMNPLLRPSDCLAAYQTPLLRFCTTMCCYSWGFRQASHRCPTESVVPWALWVTESVREKEKEKEKNCENLGHFYLWTSFGVIPSTRPYKESFSSESPRQNGLAASRPGSVSPRRVGLGMPGSRPNDGLRSLRVATLRDDSSSLTCDRESFLGV